MPQQASLHRQQSADCHASNRERQPAEWEPPLSEGGSFERGGEGGGGFEGGGRVGGFGQRTPPPLVFAPQNVSQQVFFLLVLGFVVKTDDSFLEGCCQFMDIF